MARTLKEHTPAYRETLLETAKSLLAQPVDPGLGLLGLFENSTWLVTRLQWLEKETWRFQRVRVASVTLVVGVMLCCVLPMAVNARPESESESIAEWSPEQALEQVVHAMWQAYKEQDFETLSDMILCKNEAERTAYIAFHRQIQSTYPVQYWERPIYYVAHHQISPGRYVATWLSPVPGIDDYMPNYATFRWTENGLKGDMDLSYLTQAASLDSQKVGQAHQLQMLTEWQEARGQALQELAEERLRLTQDNLLAVKRAAQLGVSVEEEYVAFQREWLEKCATLTPDQLRDAAVSDYQNGVASLTSEVQPSEPEPDVPADAKQAEAMIAPLHGLFASAYSALMEENDAVQAIKVLETALPLLDQFQASVKGTDMERTITMATDLVRQTQESLKAGDVAKAKGLMNAVNQAGPYLEEMVRDAAEQDKALMQSIVQMGNTVGAMLDRRDALIKAQATQPDESQAQTNALTLLPP
ncbi:MAG: hypothetical protein GY809_25950, partial [Planctomycetes bacterium]|nr:hypothetical protein [Planctomycetota bacterium]